MQSGPIAALEDDVLQTGAGRGALPGRQHRVGQIDGYRRAHTRCELTGRVPGARSDVEQQIAGAAG